MASLTRRRLRLVLAVTAVALAVGGGWVLLRDSSLVRVQDVTVTGIEGRQAGEVRDALTAAARDMTTLNVDEKELLAAVETYPIVKSLRTERDLLHGLRIVVNAHEPVVAAEAGGKRVAVAADGTLLRGAPTKGLARLRLSGLKGSERLTDARQLRAVRLLAAAPSALRNRVERVFRSRRGLSTTLQEGPKLYFGGGERFAAKWAAAAKVLADSSSLGAAYVDVRLPERPTAGGLPPLPGEADAEAPVADPATTPVGAAGPTG